MALEHGCHDVWCGDRPLKVTLMELLLNSRTHKVYKRSYHPNGVENLKSYTRSNKIRGRKIRNKHYNPI
jgi:hypothetical protein